MIKLLVAGACGKMGAQILSLAAKDSAFKITGAFESKGHARVGKPLSEILGIEGLNTAVTAGIESVVKEGDVVIDFTHRDATPEHVRACQAAGKAMVIGTTGLADETLQAIKQAARQVIEARAGVQHLLPRPWQPSGQFGESSTPPVDDHTEPVGKPFRPAAEPMPGT